MRARGGAGAEHRSVRAAALGVACCLLVFVGCGGGGGARRAGRNDVATSSPAPPAVDLPRCSTVVQLGDLPGELRESSGLALSRRHPGILWTHNDSGGEAAVYALDGGGRVVGKVHVTGARNADWEDVAVGPCPAGSCLYIGDIGDNDGVRDDIVVYRVPEPDPHAANTAPVERLPVSYPDGRHDAEALYVMPDEGIYIMTKGRQGPVRLYRYPGRPRPDRPATLRLLQQLSGPRPTVDALVTAADVTPDGRWVVVRTYAWLRFYRPGADGRLTPALPPPGLDLESTGQPQGEAVAVDSSGTVWLSTEGGPGGGPGFLTRLACRLPR